MTIEEARKILGEDETVLSDEKLNKLIATVDVLTEIFFQQYYAKKFDKGSKNG